MIYRFVGSNSSEFGGGFLWAKRWGSNCGEFETGLRGAAWARRELAFPEGVFAAKTRTPGRSQGLAPPPKKLARTRLEVLFNVVI